MTDMKLCPHAQASLETGEEFMCSCRSVDPTLNVPPAPPTADPSAHLLSRTEIAVALVGFVMRMDIGPDDPIADVTGADILAFAWPDLADCPNDGEPAHAIGESSHCDICLVMHSDAVQERAEAHRVAAEPPERPDALIHDAFQRAEEAEKRLRQAESDHYEDMREASHELRAAQREAERNADERDQDRER